MKILLILLIPVLSFGQKNSIAYHKKSFEFDSLITIAKDTANYIKEFEKIRLSSFLESDIFTAIKIFSIKKKYDKVIEYSNKSLTLGQDIETIFDFTDGYLTDKIKLALNKNDCNQKKNYFNIVPKSLYLEISDMALVDSKLRELNMQKKVDNNTIRFNDSLNFNSIKEIIKKYGMLTERKQGALFNKFYYLLIHCSYYHNADYEFIRSHFYETVLDGDNKPDLYAYFVDRKESEINKGQMYGSFANPYEGIGIINDIKNLDLRRLQIGACTFKNWVLLRGMDLSKLPNEYKPL